MMRRGRPYAWIACLIAFAAAASVRGAEVLEQGFEAPPASAKPHVWSHWVNGNVTLEGITADLEWMSRIGVGGLQLFDVGFHTPALVDRPLIYMSPPWQEALRHTVGVADRLGLELAVASSPGWSHTGGPWVEPRHAIKKVVWSETRLSGGTPFRGVLARPPAVTGPFQGVRIDDRFDPDAANAVRQLYVDTVLLAYRRPSREQVPVRAITSAGAVDSMSLNDGDLIRGVALPAPQRWIRIEYARPSTVQAITLAATRSGATQWSKRLEASDDGVRFRLVAHIAPTEFVQQTVAFEPVTARYFRLSAAPESTGDPWWSYRVKNAAAGAVIAFPPWAPTTVPDPAYAVTELVLHSNARVHRFEEKAGFALVPDYYAIASPSLPTGAAAAKADVIDLTDRMSPDGRLTWTPPPGEWIVLRMGYSLTGKRNQPATPEATGLEVDKLSREAVRHYAEHYFGLLEKAGGKGLGKSGIAALLQDSIETGAMNWTEHMIEEFTRLRGYDPTPWLPTLTGVVIESAAHSDRFLWDFRRTIAQLLAEHHYGEMAASARSRGMTVYAEALEDRRIHSLGDDMEMRKHADVPMGAMWTFRPQHDPWPSYVADVRGAASVAHAYGRPIVGAESFTTILNPWAFAPADLKPIADLAFVLGVNRPIIHSSVHQPFMDRKPGLSLWIVGQYFNRHETWAEQAKPWIDYLSRTAFLLQQGRFVADVAYFYGEEAPLTGLFADRPIEDVPDGYGFDFVNADIVLNELTVRNGLLVTPSGMRYRLLYLGGSSEWMTLAVLRRIEQLVEAGATMVGNKPFGSPSLADDAREFSRIADRLWSGASTGTHRSGVIAGRDLEGAMRALGVEPDFEYRKSHGDSNVMFLHRTIEHGELYFLTNRRPRAERITASLRVDGYKPQLWRAESGTREALSYRIENGRTIVQLDMRPNDAFFVVFREPTTVRAETARVPNREVVMSVEGPWNVSFEHGRGAPASARFERLASLTVHEDPGIRFFSGTAVYRKELTIRRDWLREGRLWLDLGEVGDLAEVIVNDQRIGVTWLAPHRVDVTKALRAGRNEVEIRVTNLWVNRLIGDALANREPLTFTTVPTYEADAPLRPAGLLGPVSVLLESDST